MIQPAFCLHVYKCFLEEIIVWDDEYKWLLKNKANIYRVLIICKWFMTSLRRS